MNTKPRLAAVIFTMLIILTLAASCGNMLTDALDDVNLEYYLYVASDGSNDISVYKITNSGYLEFVSSLALPTQPFSIKVHPSQNYVYAIGSINHVLFGFNINSKGLLEYATGMQTGNNPQSVCINPEGTIVYTVNASANTISQFAISGNGKLINNNTTYSTLATPYFSVMDSGDHLYITSPSNNLIRCYQVDSAGNLGSFTNSTVTSPREPVIHPGGNFMYIPQQNLAAVCIFPLNADGSLDDASATSRATSGIFPSFSVFNKTGEFFYAPILLTSELGNSIDVFKWNTDGSLTPVETVPSDTGPYVLIIHPDRNILYCANLTASTITIYSIGDDGRLSAIGTPFPCNGIRPVRMVIAKRHRFTE